MSRYRYISTGSNTTVLSGTGHVNRVLAGGANGGTVYLFDSISIGAAPNYPALEASGTDLIAALELPATMTNHELGGIGFTNGLTVAATSSAPITIVFSG